MAPTHYRHGKVTERKSSARIRGPIKVASRDRCDNASAKASHLVHLIKCARNLPLGVLGDIFATLNLSRGDRAEQLPTDRR